MMSKNDSQIVISKKTLIIALIVLLLLIAGAVTVALNWNNWFGSAPDGPSSSQTGDLDIDENAGDWNGQTLPDKTDDAPAAGIKIPGYPSITLPANQETVNVALLNPEGNPCYFTFELVLKDTGESLYKSKLVMSGTPSEVFASAQDLLEMGLDIPEITRIFLHLQEMGLPVQRVYSVEQAVQELIRLKGGVSYA